MTVQSLGWAYCSGARVLVGRGQDTDTRAGRACEDTGELGRLQAEQSPQEDPALPLPGSRVSASRRTTINVCRLSCEAVGLCRGHLAD